MNNRGSITVFTILVMFGVILVFSIYMTTLADGLTENNGLRVLENASRNIQASYDHALYFEYGLLAYEEDALKDEFEKSVKAGLAGQSGKGLLPFALAGKYESGYEKIHDLSNLEKVRDQMISQTLMNVPKAFIEHQDVVKKMFERARNAKSKIKDINKITDRIEKLKDFNAELGKYLNKAKKVEDWVRVSLTTSGKFRLKNYKLEDVQENIEDTILDALEEVDEVIELVEAEKESLKADQRAYPDEFKEKIEKQMDDFLMGDGAVIQGRFEVDGIHVENKFTDQIRQIIESKTSDKVLVQDLMDRYGYGLAAMNQILEESEALKIDLEKDYADEIEELKELTEEGGPYNREIRKAIRNEVRNEMREEVEDFLEDFDVDVFLPDDDQTRDRSLEDYVDKTRENELKDKNEADKEMEATDTTNNLSEKALSDQQMKELPSNTLKDHTYTGKILSQPLVVEYIMGTFRHRLTGSQEDPWDFYEKTDRATYFKDGEIEYILHGSQKEKVNRNWVAGEIFLIREGFNIVHVYTCQEKRTLAESFSSMVAHPLWTKPLYYHGILVGWASLESALDVQSLLKGERVAVIKLSDKDWKTSIRGGSTGSKTSGAGGQSKGASTASKNKSTNTGSGKKSTRKKTFKDKSQAYIKNMNLNEQGYDFYLRFLLNLKAFDQKKHILRSLDLMVVNKSLEDEKVGDILSLEDYWTGHQLKLNWSNGGVVYEAEYE